MEKIDLLQHVRLTEIFFSLQGETKTVGLPTVFVRLTGCPLRCQYCDTSYAFQGGEWHHLDAVLTQVKNYPAKHVTVTGGEPLAQKACIPLLKRLCDEDYIVSLETSGAIDVSDVDHRVVKILDIKTPGSHEVSRNLWSNIDYLLPHDQVKFVICHRDDYLWAKQIMSDHQLNKKCDVLFSASHDELHPGTLADWILEDGLPVRLQIQLHKYLWGDVRGR